MATLAISDRDHAQRLPHLLKRPPRPTLTLCEAMPTAGFTRITSAPPLRSGMWPESLVRCICARLDAGEDLVAIAKACHVLASEVFALAKSRRSTVLAERASCQIPPQDGSARARLATLRQQCLEPQRLWNLGMTIPEMSRELGLTQRVLRELIVRARHHLGTESFPYRTVLAHRPCAQEDALRLEDLLRAQFAEAQRWWLAGVDRTSIAQRLGLSRKCFDATVRKVRRVLGPEWFATRVLAPIADQPPSGGATAPRCAEDYALIVGLMSYPVQAPAAAGAAWSPQAAASDPAGSVSAYIQWLAGKSQFKTLIDEMSAAFATELATLAAPAAVAKALQDRAHG